MCRKVLVTYASKYGSTAQIADRISSVLESRGLDVEEMPVGKAKSAGDYKAVVLGSAVYAGQWRAEAAEWLKRNADELAKRPTWIFSSGPTGEGDPSELMNGWRLPESLEEVVEGIGPREIAFFHGNLDMDKLNFGEKLIVKAIKAPTGDFRVWDQIDSWAEEVARIVAAGVSA